MKVNILFGIKNGPRGGGNQFLKLLREQFIKMGVYTELQNADVVLFNSYQDMDAVINAKIKYPGKVFIHRVDGPIRLYNNMQDKRDNIVNITNSYIADGTVFQSQWSREKNYSLGLQPNKYETIIYNCADDSIFNTRYLSEVSKCKDKIKIIAASWSSNIKKGFKVYQYLDEHLDWDQYEMTFVGNSPIEFCNIKHIKPLDSFQLAKKLKESDIYISASQSDPCSNSVIEALSCGLPVLCYNDGGHPELVKKGGLLFDRQEEIPLLLEKVVDNYNEYQNGIAVSSPKFIAELYLDFAKKILDDFNYTPQELSWIQGIVLKQKIRKWSK